MHETYKGMDAYAEPCSGFVTVDDEGCEKHPLWSHFQKNDHFTTTGLGQTQEKLRKKPFVCGTPCAGFRQCYSYGGTKALNPKAQAW